LFYLLKKIFVTTKFKEKSKLSIFKQKSLRNK